jgi:hypothetical protein
LIIERAEVLALEPIDPLGQRVEPSRQVALLQSVGRQLGEQHSHAGPDPLFRLDERPADLPLDELGRGESIAQ